MENVDLHLTHVQMKATAATPPDRTVGEGVEKRGVEALARRRTPFPELSDPEIAGESDEAVKMVGMGMGQHHEIDAGDALAPQHGRDDAVADIEGAPGEPAAVDEHDPPSREFHEDRLALAD